MTGGDLLGIVAAGHAVSFWFVAVGAPAPPTFPNNQSKPEQDAPALPDS